MPIKIIARWSYVEGKRDEAVAALRELEREVYEQEPFVLMYTIHLANMRLVSFPTPAPTDIVFVSVFENEAAFQEHLHGPVFNDWLAKYKNLFLLNNGNLFVVSEWIEQIAGYIRPVLVTPPGALA